MKKIVIALSIVVLLVLGSYGVFGFIAKRNFDKGMADLNTQIPSHIDVTYKQGLFSSTAQLSLEIPINDNNVDVKQVITTRHTIYHGPFVLHPMQENHPAYIPVQAYTEGTLHYEFQGSIDKNIAQAFKEASTTKITAYIPFIGNPKILFSGSPLNKEFDVDGDILAIDWQGFTGSLELQGSMRNFTYDFMAPGLTIANDGPEQLVISAITSSGVARTGSFDIGLGAYKAAVKHVAIVLSAEPGDTLVLDDIRVAITADEAEALLTVSEIFDIASLSFNNKTYGPVNTTVHLRNLDAKTLSTMNREYVTIQKANSHDPQTMQDQLLTMVTNQAPALLAKSPEFEFENISLKTANGTGQGRFIIRFNGDGEIVLNPFFLMGRLSADASFGADERFLAVLIKDIAKEAMCDDATDMACDQRAAEASSNQLQALVTQKQLMLDNGKYTATVSYKDGAATLNGQPVPFF